mmetsp:Transcript_12540/g.19406  ORF Transcript_12540/g.19406 Transcript_12540/m.19406 type:complete len:271 (+) Transcript_12540:110-922(+)
MDLELVALRNCLLHVVLNPLRNGDHDACPLHPFLPCDLVAYPAFLVVRRHLLHRDPVAFPVVGLLPYQGIRTEASHDAAEVDDPDKVLDIHEEDIRGVVGTFRDSHTWGGADPLVVHTVVVVPTAPPWVEEGNPSVVDVDKFVMVEVVGVKVVVVPGIPAVPIADAVVVVAADPARPLTQSIQEPEHVEEDTHDLQHQLDPMEEENLLVVVVPQDQMEEDHDVHGAAVLRDRARDRNAAVHAHGHVREAVQDHCCWHHSRHWDLDLKQPH